MLDRISQFGLVAARQAMAQAGLAAGDTPGAAVILGAGGGQQTYDSVYEQFYGQGLNRVHPFTVPRIMPNAPASHITMEFGLRRAVLHHRLGLRLGQPRDRPGGADGAQRDGGCGGDGG